MSIDSGDLEKESRSVMSYGNLIRQLLWNDQRPASQPIRIGMGRSSLPFFIRLFSQKIAVHPIAFDYVPRDSNTTRRVESFNGIGEEDHITMEPFICTTSSKDRLFIRQLGNHYAEVTHDTVQENLSGLQCELLKAYLRSDTQKLRQLDKEARQYAWNQLKFVIVYG